MRGVIVAALVAAGSAAGFPAPKPKPVKAPAVPDLTGEWQITEVNGRPYPATLKVLYTFDKDGSLTTRVERPGLAVARPAAPGRSGITIATAPGTGKGFHIDWIQAGNTRRGLFRMDGGGLEILLSNGADGERPADFDADAVALKAGPAGRPGGTSYQRLKLVRTGSDK